VRWRALTVIEWSDFPAATTGLPDGCAVEPSRSGRQAASAPSPTIATNPAASTRDLIAISVLMPCQSRVSAPKSSGQAPYGVEIWTRWKTAW
jgi:hypothetical protein